MVYVQCRTHGQRIGYPAAYRGDCDMCWSARVHQLKTLVRDAAGSPYQKEVEDDLTRELAKASEFQKA